MFRVFLQEKPQYLTQLFTVHDAIALILPNMISSDAQPLCHFFNHLARLSDFGSTGGGDDLSSWKDLPQVVEPIAAFICHIDADMLHSVVSYIFDAIAPFTLAWSLDYRVQDVTEAQRDSVMQQHPYLLSNTLAHPAYPFLRFTCHLLRSHPAAPRVFLDAGLLALLDGLWTYQFPPGGNCDIRFLRGGLLLIIDTLAIRTELWPRIFGSKFSAWFLNVRFDKADVVSFGGYTEMKYLIVATMDHLVVIRAGSGLDTGYCQVFCQILTYVVLLSSIISCRGLQTASSTGSHLFLSLRSRI